MYCKLFGCFRMAKYVSFYAALLRKPQDAGGPVVTDVPWRVCLSVSLLATTVSCAKMDEPLEMPCRQAVVPRAFSGHHIQQFGRG